MGFGKKKKKHDHLDMNYLDLTPVRIYQHVEKPDGLIDVLVPKFKNKLMVRLTTRVKNPYIKANLDAFGTETWLQMDGNNTVARIAGKLTEKFGEEIQPVNDRLTKFLTQLYTYGFISFNELKGDDNGKKS